MKIEYIGPHPSTTFVKDGMSATFRRGEPQEMPEWLRLATHVNFRVVNEEKKRGKKEETSEDPKPE